MRTLGEGGLGIEAAAYTARLQGLFPALPFRCRTISCSMVHFWLSLLSRFVTHRRSLTCCPQVTCDLDKIYLKVDMENEAAIRLYSAAGYVEVAPASPTPLSHTRTHTHTLLFGANCGHAAWLTLQSRRVFDFSRRLVAIRTLHAVWLTLTPRG